MWKKILPIVLAIICISAVIYINTASTEEDIYIIPDSTVPLAENTEEISLNRESLAKQLEKMESGKYQLDSIVPLEQAQIFAYEFYALYPEISLAYSPKFYYLGYDPDADQCVGYRVTLISEESGKTRYRELRSATDGIIDSLQDKSDMEKLRMVKMFIKAKAEYTKTPNNLWDQCLYGCLVNGTTTCLGYSEAMMYMMDRLDVPCRIVANDVHAWNSVYVDGRWIKVDLTRE